MAALVTCTSESHDFNWLKSLNDFLNGLTEMRKRSSDSDGVIAVGLSNLEWLEVLWRTVQKLVGAHGLIVNELVASVFSTAKDGLSDFSVLL